MIKGAMALGLTATLPHNAKAAFNELRQIQEQETDNEKKEFRLYAIIPSENAVFLGFLQPQPLTVNWSNHTIDSDRISELKFNFVVWATAEQAATLDESEHIDSHFMIDQESVVVLGQPENANGKLTVRLFPNAAKNQFEGGTYASVTEIADQWRQELDNVVGIVITTPGVSKKIAGNKKPIALPPIPRARGFPLEGQIVIEFDGELDETVLAKVTSHPQTLLIQWGSIIEFKAIIGCALCGMG